LGETRWLERLARDTGRPNAIVAFADPVLRAAAQPDLMEQAV